MFRVVQRHWQSTERLMDAISPQFPLATESWQLKSLGFLWTTSQSCQGTIAQVYDCILKNKMLYAIASFILSNSDHYSE